MEKILKLKEILERKIEKTNNVIQQYNDLYNELEKENRNKRIMLLKYESNRARMAQCQRLIDELVPELKAYRMTLNIITNLIENED